MLPPWYRPKSPPPRGLWDPWPVAFEVMMSAYRAETARLTRARQVWKVIHDCLEFVQLEHTMDAAAAIYPERAKQWGECPDANYRTFPLIDMVASRVAASFHRPPLTELYFEGDEDPLPESNPYVQQWREDEEAVELDTVLQTVDLWVNCGMENAFVEVGWVEGQLEWTPIAPYEVYVHQSRTAPHRFDLAERVEVELRKAEDSYGISGRQAWSCWERHAGPTGPEWRYALKAHDGQAAPDPIFGDGINRYGAHPLVLWQRRKPSGGSIFVPGNEGIMQAQLGINLSMTDLEFGMRYTIHPVWEEIGEPEKGGDVLIGPNVTRRYPNIGEGLNPKTPTLNIDEYRESIEWVMRMLAVAADLPPDTFSPNSSTRNLGAKQHEEAALEMRRTRSWPTYRRAIRRLWQLTKQVGNYWASRGALRMRYPDNLRMRVSLAPIPRVQDLQAAAQAYEIGVRHGLDSAVEQEVQREGVSREEAMRRVIRRRRETAAVEAAVNETVAPPADESEP